MQVSSLENEYDPSIPSLTDIPYEVLETYLLLHLNTRSIFRLFSTCKTFRQMIDYPSPTNHQKWKLTHSMLSKLRLGHDSGWIQGVNYYFSNLFTSQECQACGIRTDGVWRWEYRVRLCWACLRTRTIRYIDDLIDLAWPFSNVMRS
jgi:hypothetical protein